MDFAKVKDLHIELTSRCNASCMCCARNNYGFGVKSNLVLQDLQLERLVDVINQLPNLKKVHLSGVLGDCIASKNILEILDFLITEKFFITISTNGSLRSTQWWQNLAKKFSNTNHEIIFAIDGLEDTHSIYRQNTDFNKIIANATAFIEAGGTASWQFIPFLHNEHQILEAKKLSQKLKFSRFILRKAVRFKKKALNHKTGESVDLQPWSMESKLGRYNGQPVDKNNFDYVDKSDCDHLKGPGLFLNVNGLITPCCHLYDTPVEQTDIDKELTTKNYRLTCLQRCGKKS
jgi:MoaA/NifB/PqqE/SkfB family radical SAM enzyme